MTKLEYFLLCYHKGLYKHKVWIFTCFTQTRGATATLDYLPFVEKGKYAFKDPESGDTVVLTDSDSSKALFTFREKFTLPSGSIPNLKMDVVTNYGILLANVIVLVYPFSDKIDYINEQFNVKVIENQIAKRLTTDPEYQQTKAIKIENPIYVSEYLNYVDAITSLDGLSQLVVPSATEKSLMTDPKIDIRKKELLKEYAEQLNDPAIVAKIEAELVAMDKEWIAGDLSEGLYYKGKSFDTIRKKVHIMQGYEAGFGYKPVTLTGSLSDGWTAETLPSSINALREGVYGRGKMTALGGYATKTVNRVFQNVAVTEENCGTKLGWVKRITKENSTGFIGLYTIGKSEDTLITEQNLSNYIDTNVKVRSPQFCKTKDGKFCRHCVGLANSELEAGLAAVASDVTSTLMLISMAAAHAVALKTTKYNPENSLV